MYMDTAWRYAPRYIYAMGELDLFEGAALLMAAQQNNNEALIQLLPEYGAKG